MASTSEIAHGGWIGRIRHLRLAALGLAVAFLAGCNESGTCYRTNGKGVCIETENGQTMNGWLHENWGWVVLGIVIIVVLGALGRSGDDGEKEQAVAARAAEQERQRLAGTAQAAEHARQRAAEQERIRVEAAQRAVAEAAAAERDQAIQAEMDRLRQSGGGL